MGTHTTVDASAIAATACNAHEPVMMRSSRTFVLALVLAAAIVATHAEEIKADDHASALDAEQEGKKDLDEMDNNKDGKATVDEIKAHIKEKFYTKPEDIK